VPPTPGPLAAAAVLNADLGMVILMGLVVAIPTSIAGFAWARYIGKTIQINDFEEVQQEIQSDDKPSAWLAFAPIILPIILIGFRSVVIYPTHPLGEGWIAYLSNIIGNPVIALLIGLIIASFLGKKSNREEKFKWVTGALKEAGLIILVTGAGGAFGNILRATNIGDILGEQLSGMQVGILLPFIIAAILKTAQGSSTVSIITTAAIIAPLMEALGIKTEMAKALAVLSIGAGAMTVSHINDSYFWVVSQFSHLDLKSALKSHSVATLIQGITAIVLITLLYKIF